MVREIVHCQVGQCGNQIGNAFWVTMLAEHHLNQDDGKFISTKDPVRDQEILDKINVYFKEPGEQRFVPRAVLVDLEPGTLDVIKENKIGKTFPPDNFLFGASGKIIILFYPKFLIFLKFYYFFNF